MGCTIHMEGVEDTWNLGDVLSTALFSTLTILARARRDVSYRIAYSSSIIREKKRKVDKGLIVEKDDTYEGLKRSYRPRICTVQKKKLRNFSVSRFLFVET